jgi:hypothetical protein
MTQAELAQAMGVSQVESTAACIAAIGGHLRLVADSTQATTFVEYTDALTARTPSSEPGLVT